MIFKLNENISGEEYERWRAYLESKNPDAILLPCFIDQMQDNSGEDIIGFFAAEEE